MKNIEDYAFDENDWAHFHDVIIAATWYDGKLNLNQEEMEQLFLVLPEYMRIDAYKYGMGDSPWREDLYMWYKENKMK